jgi:transcription initiation factor TFIID subunit 5
LKTIEHVIHCAKISDDCRLLALGCQTSEILICSIDPKRTLPLMKPVKELRHLLLEEFVEPKNERLLIGHTGPIFALAFDPNQRTQLLSGSQDTTIRLWHLLTWSCLTVYKMHCRPILDGNLTEGRRAARHGRSFVRS